MDTKARPASRLFKENRFVALRNKRDLYGHKLFFGGQKNGDDWLILISDIPIKNGQKYYVER